MTPAFANTWRRRAVGVAIATAILMLPPWAAAKAQLGTSCSSCQLFDFSTFRPSNESRRVAAADARETIEPRGGNLREAERKRAVTTAVLMLGGILFVGGMSIVLIVLWGFRVRRLARQPLPSGTAIDPLWYLRARKDRVHGGGGSAKAATRDKRTGHDGREAIEDDDTDPEIEGGPA